MNWIINIFLWLYVELSTCYSEIDVSRVLFFFLYLEGADRKQQPPSPLACGHSWLLVLHQLSVELLLKLKLELDPPELLRFQVKKNKNNFPTRPPAGIWCLLHKCTARVPPCLPDSSNVLLGNLTVAVRRRKTSSPSGSGSQRVWNPSPRGRWRVVIHTEAVIYKDGGGWCLVWARGLKGACWPGGPAAAAGGEAAAAARWWWWRWWWCPLEVFSTLRRFTAAPQHRAPPGWLTWGFNFTRSNPQCPRGSLGQHLALLLIESRWFDTWIHGGRWRRRRRRLVGKVSLKDATGDTLTQSLQFTC